MHGMGHAAQKRQFSVDLLIRFVCNSGRGFHGKTIGNLSVDGL